MVCGRWFSALLLLGLAFPSFAQTPKTQDVTAPLIFEPNQGQAPPAVRFLSRANGHSFFLSDTEAVLAFADPAFSVRMKLAGQNPHPQIEGVGPLGGVTNYLLGSDPAQWRRGVPHFSKVRYAEVYPGIDLIYYGNNRQLEYDFEIRPDIDPSVVQIQFQGVDSIAVDPVGDLVLHTPHGEIRQRRPIAFQKRGNAVEPVEARFRVRGDRVGFELGAYDPRLPLVIDPTFVWASYIGGPGGDQANDLAIDSLGYVYLTGITQWVDSEPAGLLNPPAGSDFEAFVTKMDSAGAVVYTTYFGGAAIDEGHSIAVDSSGSAHVTGYTTSSDFPLVNAFQSQRGGTQDAYIVKLNPGGDAILFSSYLGGSTGGNGTSDRGIGIAADDLGNVTVVGTTFADDFPVLNAFQPGKGGGQGDAFVTQFSAVGTLVFSTYLGGNGNDAAYDVAIDSDRNIVLTGFTTSNNQGDFAVPFPTANAFDPAWNGGDDIFITKMDPSGQSLIFSTYFGGSDADDGVRLALDQSNTIYVTGYTKSFNFPLRNAVQFLNGGNIPVSCGAGVTPPCFDAFLIKMHPDGQDIDVSTPIGGEDNDSGTSIAVDSAGFIHLTGYTTSLQFYAINAITGAGGFLRSPQDGFVMKLTPDLSALVFSSFLGGFGTDAGTSIGVDVAGDVYVTGFTTATEFPVTSNAAQGTFAGSQDGFIVKINDDDVVTSTAYAFPAGGGALTSTAGQSSNTTFGYVSAELASGLSPMGLEIVDLRSAGTLVNEVSLPVPPRSYSGRVYANTSLTDTTALTIVNPNDEEVEIGFYFTPRTGGTNFFGGFDLPAHAQVSGLINRAPFNVPLDQQGTLTYQANSGQEISAVAFRVLGSGSNSANAYLPTVTYPYPEHDRPVVVPQIVDGGGWSTQFYLVNPGENTITGEIRLFRNALPGEPGVPAEMQTDQGQSSVFSYSIEPRALYTLIGSGAPAELWTGFAEVVPSAGSMVPLAYAILNGTDHAGFTATTVEAVEAGTDFKMYAETSGVYPEPLAARPAVSLANSSDLPATVNLSLIGLDGVDSGLTAQVTLPSKGHLSRFLHEIPGFENLPSPHVGVLRVTTSQPGVTFAGFRGRYNERAHFLVTATGPLKALGNVNPVIFPHLVDGGGYATQFILIDNSGSGASGTFRFLNQVGTPLNIGIMP